MKNLPLFRQCVVSVGTICNMMGQGCAFGYSSVLISSFRRPDSIFTATTSEEGWIASITGIAFLFGIPMMAVIMDKFGRRKGQILTTIPFLTGWFLIALAGNVSVILVARFIQGLAVGLNIPILNIILAEMTAPRYRGVFYVMLTLSFTIGTMLIQFIGIVVSWQATAVAASFLHFISLLIFINGPEWPHWLVSKGRYVEAKEVFVYLRGGDKESETEINQLIDSQQALRISEAGDISSKQVTRTCSSLLQRKIIYFFKTIPKPEFYKPWLIVVLSYIISQLSGPNLVAAYASDIIVTLLGPDCDVHLWIVVVNIIRIVSNISLIFIFKIVKRKKVLLIGTVLTIVSYLAMAGYIYGVEKNWMNSSRWIGMIALCVYCGSNMACMTFSIVIGGEVFPLEYRGLGGGAGSFMYSLLYFLTVKCFPTLSSHIGLPPTYLVYAAIILLNLVIIMCIMPETKDRTLQDIEDSFRGVKKPNQQELKSLQNST